jgi:hypothetical protein
LYNFVGTKKGGERELKKKLFVLLILLSLISTQWLPAGTAFAKSNPHSTVVHAYTKKNGTHVSSYHRTVANRTTSDNYSHKGNYNPWTHKYGTKLDNSSHKVTHKVTHKTYYKVKTRKG